MFPKDFYILPEELFRIGNKETPKLSHVRARDVDTMQLNGIRLCYVIRSENQTACN